MIDILFRLIYIILSLFFCLGFFFFGGEGGGARWEGRVVLENRT